MKKYALLPAFVSILLEVSMIISAGAQNTTVLPNYLQLPTVTTLSTCSTSQKGQLVFLSSTNQINYCNGSEWQPLLVTSNVANTTPWLTNGNHIYNSNTANVGIGLTNPNRGKLEVSGVSGAGSTNAIFGTGSSGISLQQNWPTIGFNQYRDNTAGNGKFMSSGYAAIQYFDPGGGTMVLDMLGSGSANNTTFSGTRAYAVYSTGNMAIRGDANNASLSVFRGNGIDGTAVFYGTTHRSHFNYSTGENTYIRAGKDLGAVFINDMGNAGNVFIGGGNTSVGINTLSTAGAGTLVVHQRGQNGIGLINDWGGNRWEINNENYNDNASDPQQCLMLRYSGRPDYPIMGWFKPDNGSYFANSDRRLKKNIEQMPAGILAKVMQLKPSHYQFITSSPTPDTHFGFIAQEIMTVFPEVVDTHIPTKTGDEKLPDLHGLNYDAISVIAIKAIQEQQLIIEELKREIELLKKKVKE